MRRIAIVIIAAALALGTVAMVGAQEPTPAPQEDAKHRPGMRVMKHAIRSESVLPPREEGEAFVTIRRDTGELTAIDGSTLTIAEADGIVVEVTVDDDTRIGRDGSEASLDDLEVGDRVTTIRTKEGDAAFTTRGVRAISPEHQAEMEQRRQACQEDPGSCPRHRGRRGGDHLRGGPLKQLEGRSAPAGA